MDTTSNPSHAEHEAMLRAWDLFRKAENTLANNARGANDAHLCFVAGWLSYRKWADGQTFPADRGHAAS